MAKRLAFGLMRLPLLDPNDSTSIDKEEVKKMVDKFIEAGFTYFDTAYMYHNYTSENAVKDVLTSRHERSTYTLTTKLSPDYVDCLEDRDKVFNIQLEKTGAEYFDYYLLHDIGYDNYDKLIKYDMFNWLIDKKEKGLVKTIGFSSHDTPDFIDMVLTKHPEMEFVQIQLNYLDYLSEGIQAKKCYDVITSHNKPVFVMEPVKGGTLSNVSTEVEEVFKAYDKNKSVASYAIRFALSLPNVKMVLSGMSNMEQLLDNIDTADNFEPLNEDEYALIDKALEIINSDNPIKCTGCSYCTNNCPMNIAIPKYFSLYNLEAQEAKVKQWTSQSEYYYRLTKAFGKASDCIKCMQCEDVCPQHLKITEYLEEIAKKFEK